MGGDLQIHEAGVIHQNQTGFFLTDFLHAVFFILEFGRDQIEHGQDPNQDLQQKQRPQGSAGFCPLHSHDFFISALFGYDFHIIQPIYS